MKAASNFMPPTTIAIHQTKKIFLQSFPALNKSSNFTNKQTDILKMKIKSK